MCLSCFLLLKLILDLVSGGIQVQRLLSNVQFQLMDIQSFIQFVVQFSLDQLNTNISPHPTTEPKDIVILMENADITD